MAYRNYSTAVSHIVSSDGQGDFTTLGAALAAASTGQTIFIRPGTYTANNTISTAVNIVAYPGDGLEGNVILVGNQTISAAITVTFSGIQLQTNSANCLTVSGSAATIIYLYGCYINCTNNTGISYSSSSSSSQINIYQCQFSLGTTGIGYYSMSSTGSMIFYYCNLGNSGGSTTASSNSAGNIIFDFTPISAPLSTSSTGTVSLNWSSITATNTTCLTTAGTGTSGALNTIFTSGSASAISVGAGTTVTLNNSQISSTNTNALTGSGTLTSTGTLFVNTSHLSNVTTQTGGAASGLTQGTAPSAGFIGERISNSATAVATTSTTPKTITSINVTAGIWDISGAFGSTPTGGTAVMSAGVGGISTTNNTLGSNLGIDYVQLSIAAISTVGLSVPVVRATVSATATYYLVVENIYSSTTCPTNALISATRVG